ncbi:MAG: hypothetical protein AMXMBFR84_04990 [Candidatus Hydrogenedentota bacterium]
MATTQEARFVKISTADSAEDRSTCGFRRRIIRKDDAAPASISHLRIDNARPHFHKIAHEYYYVLSGTGHLVIDGERVPLAPGDCVWIKPYAVHYAEGDNLESLVIGIPPFDLADQYYPE